ncbi:MAG TPA: Gfo/Idh/MocA family oxidoreductase [Firmicutes bacterium]|nr:Gfo/Idh/MocA family oxidoreductase [Bacillota bacterium]
MSRKLRVGVVGLGKIAWQIYLPLLSREPSVEIATVFSRTQETRERAKAALGLSHAASSFEEFCGQGLDCAFVLTPKDTRYELVLPLLERGVDVFCEKPMATKISQARAMVETAKRNGRILMFAFNRRYAPVYVRARQVFSDSPPEIAVACKNRPGLEYRATIENTIHMIDLLTWFCGEASEVHAFSQFTDANYEKGIVATIRFKNGSLGTISASRNCGRWDERLSLYGNGITVDVNCPTETLVYRDGELSGFSVIGRDTGFADPKDTLGFAAIVKDFIHCVRTREEPCLSVESVLATHVLLNEILKKAGLPDLSS